MNHTTLIRPRLGPSLRGLTPSLAFGSSITLEEALEKALRANSEIAAVAAQANSEHSIIRSQSWPDNPKITLMRKKNLTSMKEEKGPMNLWSISQEIKFPTKYFLLKSAQKSKAEASNHESSAKRLEIRRKVISTYYGLFNAEKVLDLLTAQRETLRKFAMELLVYPAIFTIWKSKFEMKLKLVKFQITELKNFQQID